MVLWSILEILSRVKISIIEIFQDKNKQKQFSFRKKIEKGFLNFVWSSRVAESNEIRKLSRHNFNLILFLKKLEPLDLKSSYLALARRIKLREIAPSKFSYLELLDASSQ